MNQFVVYNLPSNDPSWNYLKEKHVIKVTYSNIQNKQKESFWVWIEKIDPSVDDYEITGIVSNVLITKELEIGDRIVINKKHIKEISNRSYTLNHTFISIERAKNNPITKYFESVNTQFI